MLQQRLILGHVKNCGAKRGEWGASKKINPFEQWNVEGSSSGNWLYSPTFLDAVFEAFDVRAQISQRSIGMVVDSTEFTQYFVDFFFNSSTRIHVCVWYFANQLRSMTAPQLLPPPPDSERREKGKRRSLCASRFLHERNRQLKVNAKSRMTRVNKKLI